MKALRLPARADGDRLGPASTGQRLLWALERGRGGAGALNTPVLAQVRTGLDRAAFRAAVDALVQRHEALRTVVERRNRQLVRRVRDVGTCPVRFEDLSTASSPHDAVRAAIASETAQDVDQHESPIRASVWHVADDLDVCCLNVHHFATDGWSARLLLRDLAGLYQREVGADPVPLPPVEWQYSDFVEWRESDAETSMRAEHVAYWKHRLAGARTPRIPVVAGTAVRGDATAMELAPIDDGVVDALAVVAKAQRTTLFGVLTAAFVATLARTTGDRDVAVTVLLSDRTRPELWNTVGHFISAVVLRVPVPSPGDYPAVIRECRDALFGAVEHQAVPLLMLPPGLLDTRELRVEDVVFQVMGDGSEVHPPFEPWPHREPGGVGRTFALEFVVLPLFGHWYATALFAPGRFDPAWVREALRELAATARDVAQQSTAPLDPSCRR